MFDIVVKELHTHTCDVGVVLGKLVALETNIKEYIMATKDEVLAAAAAEAGEVAARITELQAKIDELIAAGTGASAADLDEIKLAIQGIFNPA